MIRWGEVGQTVPFALGFSSFGRECFQLKRSRSKKKSTSAVPLPADRTLLALELSAWAGARIARGGRRDALLGRVEALRLSLDGRAIEARVRGNRPLPYHVSVRAGEPQPVARCTCSGEAKSPCRHAVAVLEALRFPRPAPPADPPRTRGRGAGRGRAGRGRVIQHAPAVPGFVIIGGEAPILTREERISLVRREELALRRQRAHGAQTRLRLLTGGGPPHFEIEPRRGGIVHRVTLRGEAQYPACTCDDFAENELMSCLHVERVRGWLARHPREVSQNGPLLSVWSRPREWLEEAPDAAREIRLDLGAGQRPAGLDRYFDPDGWLRSPEGGRGEVSWAARAVVAAGRAARSRGLAWDLDPAVSLGLRERAAALALAQRRAAFLSRSTLWDEVGSRLQMSLHDYQKEGARFLARTGRALLADDMGLGKTVQAIVAALLLRRTVGAARALVVCPASLKHQWRREIDKACGEPSVVVEGPPSRRRATYAAWREGFLIVNYELVLRDLDALGDPAADLVILDEAQRIKNWNTQTARAVKQLRSPHAFILTGTPLENRLAELHSLVEFLHPRALGPRWRLAAFHSVTESRGRVIAYEGLDVLRRRLAGFFLRRERREVMDQLPPRTDNTFWTGMTAAQRRPYRQHSARAATLLSRGGPLGPAESRALYQALTSMRILCNAYAQYAWAEHEPLLRQADPQARTDLRGLHSPKLEEFARVFDDLLESEEKVVVFSQWERMLRLAHFVLKEALERRDLRAEIFHGRLNSRARDAMLEAFRTDPEFRVMFSTDAGGLGLNLQHASVVVNLEVPWNPAVIEQRVGRVHRMGQRRSVQVLHFVTRGALEERVRQVVEEKRALFDGLLVDDADRVVLDAAAQSTFVERVRLLLERGSAPPIS